MFLLASFLFFINAIPPVSVDIKVSGAKNTLS